MEQTTQILEKLEEINKNITILKIEIESLKEELIYPPEINIKKEFIREVQKKEREGKFETFKDIDTLFHKLEKNV